jgi:glucose/mannose transport system permease protein
MTEFSNLAPASQAAPPRYGQIALRWLLFTLLGLFALFYLMPLFVMVTTSLKSLEEIRSGSLVAFPREVTFEAWRTAWSGACTGIQCEGLRPYFWNSVLLAVPAVLISSFLGAANGYVIAQWNFRGANLIFSALSGGAAADGPDAGTDGVGGHHSGADLCPCDLWHWLYHAVFPQFLCHHSR